MKKILLFALAFSCGMLDFEFSQDSILPAVNITKAEARPGFRAGYGTGRRVARRTVRRTARRVTRRAYYRALPGGCYWASPYYNCDGVYYESALEDGATVYVIVDVITSP